MKLLLTNDDGIYAEGIKRLGMTLARAGHQITLISPDRERSATGHSITIHEPLRATEIELSNMGDNSCYKISGTPADCVKIGLERLLSYTPDLIISGINDGANLGYDVLYSGTVSAAIEGFMIGYHSLALSLVPGDHRDFSAAAELFNRLLNKINFRALSDKILLNINFPASGNYSLNNIHVTRLSKCIYRDYFEEREDPMGNKYYWMTGQKNQEINSNTDIWAVEQGKISLTPLKLELTDKELMKDLSELLNR